MTFQAGIPNASDLISVSQSDLKNNFTSLSTSWNVNHVDFNDSGAGKHKFVEFPNQSSNPTTAASEVAIYAKDLSGVSTLYMRKASNGTVIQMSGIDPVASTNGYTFLPGGLLLQWGSQAGVTNGATVNFPIAFSACYNVQVTINIASTVSPVGINGFSASGFTFRTTAGGGVPITFMAIGAK